MSCRRDDGPPEGPSRPPTPGAPSKRPRRFNLWPQAFNPIHYFGHSQTPIPESSRAPSTNIRRAQTPVPSSSTSTAHRQVENIALASPIMDFNVRQDSRGLQSYNNQAVAYIPFDQTPMPPNYSIPTPVALQHSQGRKRTYSEVPGSSSGKYRHDPRVDPMDVPPVPPLPAHLLAGMQQQPSSSSQAPRTAASKLTPSGPSASIKTVSGPYSQAKDPSARSAGHMQTGSTTPRTRSFSTHGQRTEVQSHPPSMSYSTPIPPQQQYASSSSQLANVGRAPTVPGGTVAYTPLQSMLIDPSPVQGGPGPVVSHQQSSQLELESFLRKYHYRTRDHRSRSEQRPFCLSECLPSTVWIKILDSAADLGGMSFHGIVFTCRRLYKLGRAYVRPQLFMDKSLSLLQCVDQTVLRLPRSVFTPNELLATPRFLQVEQYHMMLECETYFTVRLHLCMENLHYLELRHTVIDAEVFTILPRFVHLESLCLDHCTMERLSDSFPGLTCRLRSLRVFNMMMTMSAGPHDTTGEHSFFAFTELLKALGQDGSVRRLDFSSPYAMAQGAHRNSWSFAVEQDQQGPIILVEYMKLLYYKRLTHLRVRIQTDKTKTWLSALLREMPLLRVLILENPEHDLQQTIALPFGRLPSLSHFVGSEADLQQLTNFKSLQCIGVEVKVSTAKDLATSRTCYIDTVFQALPRLQTLVFFLSEFDTTIRLDDIFDWKVFSRGFKGVYDFYADRQLWNSHIKTGTDSLPSWKRVPRTITVYKPQMTKDLDGLKYPFEVMQQERAKLVERPMREEPWVYESMNERRMRREDPCLNDIYGERPGLDMMERAALRQPGYTSARYL